MNSSTTLIALDYAPFSPKYDCTLFGVAAGQSKVKAIQALADVCRLSTSQARYIVDNLPQKLCISGSETFYSVVLNEEERRHVDAKLSELFDLSFDLARDQVLPFGSCVTPPWAPNRPPAVG